MANLHLRSIVLMLNPLNYHLVEMEAPLNLNISLKEAIIRIRKHIKSPNQMKEILHLSKVEALVKHSYTAKEQLVRLGIERI